MQIQIPFGSKSLSFGLEGTEVCYLGRLLSGESNPSEKGFNVSWNSRGAGHSLGHGYASRAGLFICAGTTGVMPIKSSAVQQVVQSSKLHDQEGVSWVRLVMSQECLIILPVSRMGSGTAPRNQGSWCKHICDAWVWTCETLPSQSAGAQPLVEGRGNSYSRSSFPVSRA